MQEQDIDIQLWSYIDGTADNAERERIAALIATDKLWKEQYEAVLAFHSSLNDDLQPEKVSTGFADSVMNKINAPAVTKKSPISLIYTWGIRAVGIFFIGIISWLLIDAVSTMQFSASESRTDILPELNFNISLPQMSNTTIVYAGFVVLILLLLTADKLFRNRIRQV